MNYTIEFDKPNCFFILKAEGIFSLDHHKKALNKVVLHPERKDGVALFFDFRECSFENFKVHDIEELVLLVTVLEGRYGQAKTAIVMPEKGYSYGTLFKFKAELGNPERFRVFHTAEYEKAISWIRSSDANPA